MVKKDLKNYYLQGEKSKTKSSGSQPGCASLPMGEIISGEIICTREEKLGSWRGKTLARFGVGLHPNPLHVKHKRTMECKLGS